MAITMTVENITPEKAREYLKTNTDNYRKISRAKSAIYAREMKAGKWELNGEGIMFAEDGTLKNGQHRLAAILMAGIPVRMTVIRGIGSGVNIYDNGMTRSVKQMAQAGGCGDISGTEAAVGSAIVGRFQQAPKGEVISYLQKHWSEINRAYKLSRASSRKSLSGRMCCVLAAYLMLRAREAKSYDLESFYQIFSTGNIVGTEGYEPSSALVARRIFEDRYKGVSGTPKTNRDQTEIMVRALDDFLHGKKRQLNYQIREPMLVDELMTQVRQADGLE